MMLHELGVKIGTRSKLVNQQIAAKCREHGATDEQAQSCGDVIAKAIVKDTLYFFTDTEVEEFAKYAQSKNFDAGAVSDKDIQKLSKKALKLAVDGLDIALFGRMVAQAPELNVQAASSFSHAISTHAVNNEIEFSQLWTTLIRRRVILTIWSFLPRPTIATFRSILGSFMNLCRAKICRKA